MAMETFFAATSPTGMVVDWDPGSNAFEVHDTSGHELASNRGSDCFAHSHHVGILDAGPLEETPSLVARRRYYSLAAEDFTYEIGCQIGVGPNNRTAHFWGQGVGAGAHVNGHPLAVIAAGRAHPKAKAVAANPKAQAKAMAAAAMAKAKALPKPRAKVRTRR